MDRQENARAFLRHTVATLAYRGAKVVKGVPPDFPAVKVRAGTKTPLEILAHIGDLLDWARLLADGKHVWHDARPDDWQHEVARFFRRLDELDKRLADDAPLGYSAEKLFQGPIADALTHIGQIAMLRRIAGAPVRGENYFRADIATGRTGPEQPAPRTEFD